MAVAFRARVAEFGTNGTGARLQMQMTGSGLNAEVGDLLVIRVAADNLSGTTPTISAVSDSIASTNTYTVVSQRVQNTTAAAGVMGALIVSKITQQLPNATLLYVDFSSASTAHKAGYAELYSGVEATQRSTAVSASATSTAASAVSGTVNAGDLVIGAVAVESRAAPTYDADTLNGSWAGNFNKPSTTSGSDTSAVCVNGQYKIATASGAQTFNNTVANTDWCAFVAVFQATPEVPVAPAARTISAAAGTPPSTAVNLTWADDTAANPDPTYLIERSPDGSTGWTTVATGQTGQTGYNVTGLTALTTYYFRVTGTNASGSTTSNVAGPITTAAALSGRPKVYLAGSFQQKPLKVWTGAAWVEKPIKIWTGSAWKTLT